jgi:cytochrome d ubiquinol oxidase subunit II
VPLGADNYFFLPLWTNWRTGATPGILDWYTIIGGVLAVIALAMHGALYLALKTVGELEQRAFRWAGKLWPAVLLVTVISLPATVLARPNSLANYRTHPLDFLAPILVVLSLGVIRSAIRARKALRGFLGSCVYLAAMLAGAAAGLYPALLPSVGGAGQDLTVARAIASTHTLHIGMVWWTIGMLLALMYFSIVYWLFRGKVSQHAEGYGH